jgi:HNH endonuclease
MPSDISTELRQFIALRAAFTCEFCRLPQMFSLHKHEPDHILPRQHGGETEERNLALACFRCNRYKGPNVGSFDPHDGSLVPFFNPRSQKWNEHFRFEGATITPLTAEARVTVKILQLNAPERLIERQYLIAMNLTISDD